MKIQQKNAFLQQPFYIEKKHRTTVIVLEILLVAAILASFLFGRYPVPPRELAGILWNQIIGGIEPYWTQQMQTAVWNIRLPRILLSVLVGASLASAGAAYQGVFQNAMASPDILGASAGAGFGAALAILMGFSGAGITAAAFGTSLLTVMLVLWISRYTKGDRVLGLILASIIVSSLFQAGISFIKLAADPGNKLPQITYWLMGSLSGADWSDVSFVTVPVLAGMIPLFLLRWKLNVLTMGDDEARALGLNPQMVRIWVIVCSTLLTAASVSVSGTIGWVGLVIPHMMRKLTGSDYRFLMPASILGGATFLLLVDNVSRNAAASGLPIGILTAFIGAPFFLWLITGRREPYES